MHEFFGAFSNPTDELLLNGEERRKDPSQNPVIRG